MSEPAAIGITLRQQLYEQELKTTKLLVNGSRREDTRWKQKSVAYELYVDGVR